MGETLPYSRKQKGAGSGTGCSSSAAESRVAGGVRSLKQHTEGLEQTELKQEVKCPMKISNPHEFSFVFRTVLSGISDG